MPSYSESSIIRNKENESFNSSSQSKYSPSLLYLDTSDLEEGVVYSYKQLCSILGIPMLSGNAKPHQLLELSRWFDYEKISTRYLIKEIYEYPLSYLPIASTSKYISDMVEIMLSYLYSSNEEVLYLKPSDVYLICGLTNKRYIKYNTSDSSLPQQLNVSPKEVMFFFDRADSYLKGIVKRALESMKTRNIIQYVDTYIICSRPYKYDENNYELREATTYDRQCIMKVQNKVMKMFNISSENELYGSKKKDKQKYYSVLHDELRKECPEWQYCYRTYKIYSSPEIIHQLSSTSVHQRNLNLKVFKFLNDQAVKEYKERLKKEPPKEANEWLKVQKQLAEYLIKM